MKAALAAKIAMCVCPTALVATAVTTVPQIRRAVHHASRPHKAALTKLHRGTQTTSAQPCAASYGGNSPAIFTMPLPIDPVGPGLDGLIGKGQGSLASGPGVSIAGGGGIYIVSYGGGGSAGGGSSGGGGGTTGGGGTGAEPAASAVPEPATWLFLVTGFGIAGAAMRRRPALTGRALAGGFTFGGAMPLRAKLAGSAMGSGSEVVGVATSAKTAALAKLAMCVCPPALIVGGMATLPAARQAVHDATAPKIYAAPTPSYALPCDPLFARSSAKAAQPAAQLRDIGATVRPA